MGAGLAIGIGRSVANAADASRERESRAMQSEARTTATNCEFSGYLSWKVIVSESPSASSATILRASMLLSRGLGPYGTMRTRYGGFPSLPEILMDRSSHCVGLLWKLQV